MGGSKRGAVSIRAWNNPSQCSPPVKELYWAAGFLDGECSIDLHGNGKTKDHIHPRIAARQNEKEPLDKLQRLFGGTIGSVNQRSNKLAKQSHIWNWSVTGARAIGVMLTIFSMLTEKRRTQITTSMNSYMTWINAPKEG